MPWRRIQPSHASDPAGDMMPGRAQSSAPRWVRYALSGVFLSYLSPLYTRAMHAQPLMLEDGIQVLICPSSLEPHVLDEVTLAAQAQALKQRYRRCILTVGNRDHTMQLQCPEGVVEDT